MREFLQNFTKPQINLSEARDHFLKNNKSHHAQKDISEALEQKLYNSKDISEAHRVF